MMDMALLTASVNQLKTVLKTDPRDNNMYYLLLVGICISILLQIVVGFILINLIGLDLDDTNENKDTSENKNKDTNENKIEGAPAESSRTQEQIQAQRTNTASVILIAVIMGLNVILASFADHTSFKKPVQRYTVFPCNNNATISFTATLKARRDLIISDVVIKGLEGQCHGVGEGKCDAYVLMKIGTNEVEVTQGSREDKVADDDNPKMSLPSDGYTANKPREYEFRDIVNGTWTLNSRFAQIANFTTMRLELRIGVFDFNGWSADQPIGKAKYVFENVLELEEHTPTGPIVMNICKPELTKEIVATHSNAGVYVGTFLLLAVLVIGGVVLFFCLRTSPVQCCLTNNTPSEDEQDMAEAPANHAVVEDTTNEIPSEDGQEVSKGKEGEASVDENPMAETTNGTPSEDKHEKTEVNVEEVSASVKVVAETE